MNKTAIKNFAIWARNKLIADISYKAGLVGITEDGIAQPLSPQSTNDAQFFNIGTRELRRISGVEISQRRALVERINDKARHSDHAAAFKSVIEEVAYTWFNRLIAIRFMEVNEYLPTRVRVLSSATGKIEPDIVTTPFEAGLEFSSAEREYVNNCKADNKLDELFRFLFIKQCNALNAILPELFEHINDYTELLLGISFTDKDGIVCHLVNDIEENDFKEAVEIIGWIYQYYNTEPKQEVFDGLKKNIKITKDRIPAATQLFTPDWIVRYMVENSLGRIFVGDRIQGSGFSGTEIERIAKEKEIADSFGWKYYLPEAEQKLEVRSQLSTQHSTLNTQFNIEDVKLLDPCMGSGHILVYAFDVLMQIYQNAGYTDRDAARLILEKNLHGLDIDKRAYQLAYFALMMKARQYDRRIFVGANCVRPQLCHPAGWPDGEEYGSLLHPVIASAANQSLHRHCEERSDEAIQNIDNGIPSQYLHDGKTYNPSYTDDLRIWNYKRLLTQKYDVVVTNPPYMGSSGMNGRLAEFVKKHYPDSKSDIFAAFIERCVELTKPNGYTAMITQHSWMFLSSFEKLRTKLLKRDIVNMAHLGARSFAEISGEVVQSAAFVMRNSHTDAYKGAYARLVDISDAEEKEREFLSGSHRHVAAADNFAKIPGSPMAYWVSEKALNAFVNPTINDIAEPRHGLATSNNDLFLKLWYEIVISRSSLHDLKYPKNYKWIPMNKGGSFRKWFGNNEWVINYENDGREIKKYASDIYVSASRTIQNTKYYFQKSLTWSALTSGTFSVRSSDIGYIFGSGGYCAFVETDMEKYVLALLNNVVTRLFVSAVSPTLNYEVGHIKTIPVIMNELRKPDIDALVTQNIALSRADWDSFEISWDFKRHPLVP